MSNTRQINRTCPYLGLKDDPDTSMAFPSVWNSCHRSKPVASPKLRYQGDFCLHENYHTCPVFERQEIESLPENVRAQDVRGNNLQRNFVKNIIVYSIVLFVFSILLWGMLSQNWFELLPMERVIPTAPELILTAVSIPTQKDELFPTNTGTDTSNLGVVVDGSIETESAPTIFFSATPNETKNQTSSLAESTTPTISLSNHRLDIPIGTEYKFIIHKITGGENLNQLSIKYNTNANAILAVNYKIKIPVWVGAVIVIPIGLTDVTALPVFQTYQLVGGPKNTDLISQELGVDVNQINYYNDIREGESLKDGDWLLIPRSIP